MTCSSAHPFLNIGIVRREPGKAHYAQFLLEQGAPGLQQFVDGDGCVLDEPLFQQARPLMEPLHLQLLHSLNKRLTAAGTKAIVPEVVSGSGDHVWRKVLNAHYEW